MIDITEIDSSALARLDRLGGPGFALRIIGIFLAECPRRIADARTALAGRDGDALGHAAHAVISSAGNVGAVGLAEFARGMEEDAEAARWETLTERVETMAGGFEAIRLRLEAVRGDAGP